jgi:hypothetical protein
MSAADLATAYEARSARDGLRDVARYIERLRALTRDDKELSELVRQASDAVDAALVRVGELRHRIASDAMTRGYTGG